jgi:hypothetical protein
MSFGIENRFQPQARNNAATGRAPIGARMRQTRIREAAAHIVCRRQCSVQYANEENVNCEKRTRLCSEL